MSILESVILRDWPARLLGAGRWVGNSGERCCFSLDSEVRGAGGPQTGFLRHSLEGGFVLPPKVSGFFLLSSSSD